MADPLGGLGNLNDMGMGNFGSKMGIGGLNQDLGGYNNITKLDDFIGSMDGISTPDSIDQLQGVVTKIQGGESINQSDLANLTGEQRELVSDLSQLVGGKSNSAIGVPGSKDVVDGFADVLGNYMNAVDQKAKTAEKAVQTFASGGNIDLHSVMIAGEKASLSMQMTVQLRNKMVDAYRELQRIRV